MSNSRKRDEKNKAKQLVQDRERRTNLKSKRKRNIIKKAIELSHMCNMDILILIRDREMDKIFQYSSGQAEDVETLFTVDKAIEHYERLKEVNGKIKIFNDSDYEELKILYNRNTQSTRAACSKDEFYDGGAQ